MIKKVYGIEAVAIAKHKGRYIIVLSEGDKLQDCFITKEGEMQEKGKEEINGKTANFENFITCDENKAYVYPEVAVIIHLAHIDRTGESLEDATAATLEKMKLMIDRGGHNIVKQENPFQNYKKQISI